MIYIYKTKYTKCSHQLVAVGIGSRTPIHVKIPNAQVLDIKWHNISIIFVYILPQTLHSFSSLDYLAQCKCHINSCNTVRVLG